MSVTTPNDHIYYLTAPKKMKQKNIILTIIGIACLGLAGYLFWAQGIALAPTPDTGVNLNKDKTENKIITPSSQIVISNQIPGEVVLVSEVTMAIDGWVVVHDNDDGHPGNILGAARLSIGTYKNKMIPLLRAVVDNNSYLIVIHQDNGDRVFDYKIDTPIINQKGQPEMSEFNVVAESPRGG
jgi:hypothetical protein